MIHSKYRTALAPAACAFLVACACLFAGCNKQDAGNLARDTGQLAHDTGTAVGGITLAGKVNTVLSMRKGVRMGGLHVEADGAGNVKITGSVPDKAEVRRIRDTVDGITGVHSVSVSGLKIQL